MSTTPTHSPIPLRVSCEWLPAPGMLAAGRGGPGGSPGNQSPASHRSQTGCQSEGVRVCQISLEIDVLTTRLSEHKWHLIQQKVGYYVTS